MPSGAGAAAPRGDNLVLIGPRGSGKSSVGQAAALRLRRPWADTDVWVCEPVGQSIRAIFETQGEAAFRQMERDAIHEAVCCRGYVISVGGGAVLRADNRAALRRAGWCVWLTAPATELHRRLAADPNTLATRPRLTAADALAEIEQVLGERAALYAEVADAQVETGGRSIDQVVDAVLRSWPQRPLGV